MKRTLHRRWPAFAALGLLLAAIVAGLAYGETRTADAQAAASCRWKSLGQSTLARYYEGGAFDTVGNQMYFYGGMDGSRQVQDDVGMLDLSDPDLDAASHRTVPVSAKKRYGAAGAFRAAGDDSALLFFGGASSASDGRGTSDVQMLSMSDLSWSDPQITGTLESRLFAAAAYDPEHDLIVITGGARECAEDALPCDADQFQTKYLRFGPSGMEFEDGPAGGPTSLFGHSMVYDSQAKRMIVYGGARKSDRPDNKVYFLDLAGPDPAAATWTEETPTGGPSGLALHGAAYDPTRSWLVVYGGATSDLFAAGDESANTKTYVLDLGQPTMTWTDLSASFGERIGGVMGFDTLHQAAVFHAGRRKVAASDSADAFRDSQALVCEETTPGTPTTPPPATTVAPTTEVPPTAVPTTEVPPSAVPTTEVPPTGVPTTEVPPTGVPTTEVPPTVVPTTEVPPTGVPTTEVPPTVVPTTQVPPTGVPTTGVPPTAVPTVAPGVGQVCDYILDRVPAQVINSAVTNPETVLGWKQLCDPNKPESRFNYERTYLSLRHIGSAYHPLYNGLEWKCGCP